MVVATQSVAVQLAHFAPLGGAESFLSTVPEKRVLGIINEHQIKNGMETGWQDEHMHEHNGTTGNQTW